MPQLREPKTLVSLCQDGIEAKIYNGNYTKSWLQSVGELIPYSIADNFLENILKNVENCSCPDLEPLFTAKIKKLTLSEDTENETWDDTIYPFLLQFTRGCSQLQKLFISTNVCKKFNHDVRQLLENIDFTENLKSLIVESCLYVLNTEDITLKVFEKLKQLEFLEELDLSGAKLNEECLKVILKMTKLVSLTLNNCKLSSIQVLQILTGIPRLKILGKLENH